jgi:D-aminopeptidase
VPIVPGAIVFDLLNGGDKSWGRRSPYYDLGLRAADAATDGTVVLGSVGAGLGATTADLKGGVGSASTTIASGHRIGAVAVVNALGSGLVGSGPQFWAAPYEQGAEFGGLGWPPLPWPADELALRTKGATPATTIACVATDATLTKAEAHRIAVMAHDGLARALRPVHAALDGDTVFAAATGHRPDPVDPRLLTEIGTAAADCLARAIARGLFAATNPGPPYKGPPAWHDLYAAAPRRRTTA